MRFSSPLALALLAACTGTVTDSTRQAELEAELVTELETAERLPVSHLVIGEDYETRPVLSPEETRAKLGSDPDLKPLRDALESGGLSDDEATALVFAAAGHGSGQSWDSLRVRHEAFRSSYLAALDRFKYELEKAEAETGLTVPRKLLYERGVVGAFDPAEVE